MKNSILITAIISTAIFSCKDKEKDQPTPKPSLSAKQTMLIGKDWKFNKLVYEGTDMSSSIPACVKDNIMYHFTDATNGYFDEGATKCDAADPQKGNFTWKLDNNETKLITINSEGNDTFSILSLTAVEMKLSIEKTEITLK
jgi:hypothetical protein